MKRNFCYIELIVEKSLDVRVTREWFAVVKSNGPDGIIAAIPISTQKKRGSFSFFHEKQKDKHCYIAVLSRDLNVEEAQKIVLAWNRAYSEGDFSIEFSQLQTVEHELHELQEDTLEEITQIAAKLYHTRWYQDQTKKGWRYASKMNQKEKTHPQLLPWDQLAEKYQQQSLDTIKCILDTLGDMNLALIRKKS